MYYSRNDRILSLFLPNRSNSPSSFRGFTEDSAEIERRKVLKTKGWAELKKYIEENLKSEQQSESEEEETSERGLKSDDSKEMDRPSPKVDLSTDTAQVVEDDIKRPVHCCLITSLHVVITTTYVL